MDTATIILTLFASSAFIFLGGLFIKVRQPSKRAPMFAREVAQTAPEKAPIHMEHSIEPAEQEPPKSTREKLIGFLPRNPRNRPVRRKGRPALCFKRPDNREANIRSRKLNPSRRRKQHHRGQDFRGHRVAGKKIKGFTKKPFYC